jgi:hypothetical protein
LRLGLVLGTAYAAFMLAIMPGIGKNIKKAMGESRGKRDDSE